jgi:hypothetical protein
VGSTNGVASLPPYDARLPFFHQLDLRIEKSRKNGPMRWTLFVDVQNVYFARNPLGVTYNYDYSASAHIQGIPFLPIFGVRGEYE